MEQVAIQAIPNQSFSLRLDNDYYNIALKFCINIMAVDIARNNVQLLSGSRCVPGTPLIPYKYLETGNFTFITMNDDYPDYRQFGITQFLIYASPDEIEAINAGT